MKIEKVHIKYIQDEFATMQSRADFLDLLNYAKTLIYGKEAFPFELKQITFYANPKSSNKAYKEFQIKKKSGGIRTIYAPEKGLKAIQKTLALILQCVFEPHEAAKGFVIGNSIVDNAKEHVGQNYVYNIDLKDFFPSIDQARVWACLKLIPFNLVDSSHGRKNNSKESITLENFRILDVQDSEESNVIKFYFQNASFVEGSYSISLEKEGKIAYKIEKQILNKNENFGTIILFKEYSNLELLENYLYKKAQESQLDLIKILQKNQLEFKQFFNYKLRELIISHQEKLKGKNNKIKIADIIASISCTEMIVERKDNTGVWQKVKRNVLPQGAPTSPVFSNIICQRLDKRLSGVAKRFNLNYTRYADDITFSSMHNVYQENSKFLKELTRIIKEQNFDIKESKTRLQKTGFRQEVTGLIVNDKVNVRKRYLKQIRMWLYYWEKYGYNKAEAIFLRDYTLDKGHIKNVKPNFQNVLSGKLKYLKMVKGVENTTYIALNKRFEKLIGYIDPIDRVLTEWENNGIESAMEIYKTYAHE